jgi:diguanylate cyclase (GGDEF)-like protein
MIVWLIVSLLILIYWLAQGGFMRAIWWLACIALFISMSFVLNILVAAIYISIAALIISIGIIINAYNLAYRDELTQLPSRRALKQQLLALGKTYTIAMVDVDHFKKLNDTYGHDVGDDVLKLLAKLLSEIEGSGKPFRYGGEEFTLVFPGKDIDHAADYLEDLRKRIATTPFVIRHKKRPRKKPEKKKQPDKTTELEITVSIGAAEKQDKHENPQDVIKSADNALYKAKQKGRDQVVIG